MFVVDLWEQYEETPETVGDGGNVSYGGGKYNSPRETTIFIVSVNQLDILRVG